MFSTPFYKNSDKLRWNQFKEMYERSHRRPVNRFSAYGYDSAGLVLAAMDRVPISRAELVDKLRSGREYDGATGIYTVDSNGRVARKYFVLRLASGNILPAEMALSPHEAGQDQPDSTAVQAPPVNSPN
jgi:ABC-type branched-subunit amino acid transport system substrate-binding protein